MLRNTAVYDIGKARNWRPVHGGVVELLQEGEGVRIGNNGHRELHECVGTRDLHLLGHGV
jgi:hypothetical protein